MVDEIRPVRLLEDRVSMLDQRRLPWAEEYLDLLTPEQVAKAIRDMAVRGAPAIGISAAMGVALGAINAPEGTLWEAVEDACLVIEKARPTAVNLAWAVGRMRRVAHDLRGKPEPDVRKALVDEANAILDEDIAMNRAMGRHGANLVPDGATVMTHCNAGALATGGYGTALGVIRAARETGKRIKVVSCETRPFLQGSRLTCWELARDGFDVTLVTDGAAGSLMAAGMVDCVVVGADRIAANGDTANKIGTYTHAVLADRHGIPFYVAAPSSTLDPDAPDGRAIPIEQRPDSEVLECGGRRMAAEGVRVLNPAFDVTPWRLVSAIITEKGVFRPGPGGFELTA